MEPETKVFPAIFVEATSKEVMQIELGRTSTTLPLSAALLQNSERHVIPQVGNFQLLIVFKKCEVM
jgi:ryanodine receptor 2